MPPSVALADNAYGTIAASITATDSSITFTSGHGARFPVVVSTGTTAKPLHAALINSGNVVEEIKITVHGTGSDTATIVRAVGGTTAKSWSAGDRIEARVSKSVLEGLAGNQVAVLDYASDAEKTSIEAADYTVDVTGVVNKAFANTDRAVRVNTGGYLLSSAPAAPVCGLITGEGWGNSILAPANGVLTAIAWDSTGPKAIRDLQVSGNATASARGIVIGENSAVTNSSMSDINVQDYSGSNAIGIYLRDVVGFTMKNVRSSNNKYPLIIDRASGSYPTTINSTGGSWRTGDYNIFVASGGDITLADDTCEAAQNQGMLVSPALGASYAELGSAHVTELRVVRMHFESNCVAVPVDLFHALVNADAANTSAKVTFKDCTFGIGSDVKAVFASGQFTEVIVDNPRATSTPPAGWLTVSNNAKLIVRNWDTKRLGSPFAAITASGGGKLVVEGIPPCFTAYNSASIANQTGNGAVATVAFDSETMDDQGFYTSNTYTALHTGRHHLTASVLVTDLSTAATLATISIVTTNRTYSRQYGLNPKAGALQAQLEITAPNADMEIGDTATVTVSVAGMSGDTATIYGAATELHTSFSGYPASVMS